VLIDSSEAVDEDGKRSPLQYCLVAGLCHVTSSPVRTFLVEVRVEMTSEDGLFGYYGPDRLGQIVFH
jgi:hypothetical protein